ncbi:hypothetical protein K4L06_08195 [Lysobacter sp. BMK333-48F3]|uniref:hypothetical protein n=1 Tax=Lysobacter sp. BMK333-48F3 TaxID=2867962 RepID=UPI001C8C390C|nr:hypothetical protein [Lysobacter sp. BMK333-48F3]MBX9401293.1 hypothetical protein [Lysobacter sp. BMK333-48F3]
MPTFDPETEIDSLLGEDPQRRLGPWHAEGLLVVGNHSRLPARCVKCNAPAAIPMQRRSFVWHPWVLYLLAPINLLIYAIAVALVRKKVEVTLGLCARHERWRAGLNATRWLGIGAGAVMFFVAPSAIWMLYALVVLLLALAFGHWFARPLVPVAVGEHYARFRGCTPAFLDGLPRYEP